jgi:hypothetical protein
MSLVIAMTNAVLFMSLQHGLSIAILLNRRRFPIAMPGAEKLSPPVASYSGMTTSGGIQAGAFLRWTAEAEQLKHTSGIDKRKA